MTAVCTEPPMLSARPLYVSTTCRLSGFLSVTDPSQPFDAVAPLLNQPLPAQGESREQHQ
jgi:hypothetical protein